MSRLFVAVWPPPALLEALRGLERPVAQGLRWTTEDQWHVTLRFLGNVDAGAIEPLRGELADAAAGSAPAEVHAGPRPGRLGRAVWALPVVGLEVLASAVVAVTSDVGRPSDARRPPDARPFRGHLTLARAREPSALRRLPTPDVNAWWHCDELTLVSSRTDPRGARYEVIDRWRLGGIRPRGSG